ncbi:hypothetical protein OAT08_03260 [Pelagibacteraceae bacterium]|jgi:hypothetical protein|nr:hypothetical protein [Pelagibacteraceae bacterium]
MIEKIKHKKKLFALIVRGKYRSKKGVSFFTENKDIQQFGYMNHKKLHVIKPHIHKRQTRKLIHTSEVILLLKGILRVDFYEKNKKYLFSKILREKDIIMLVHGAHGFKVIKNVQMLEIKQGPYINKLDKVKFEEVNESKIKIKK